VSVRYGQLRDAAGSRRAYRATTSNRRTSMASSSPNEPQPTVGRLLTIVEVATALGVDVRHVRRLVHEKCIPYIKWGHLLRFDLAEIATWIDSHRNHPSAR
jgi:excisionase family DNA binding protein